MAKRFCTHCGKALVIGARFCVACGQAADGAVQRGFRRRWPSARTAPLTVTLVVLLVGGGAVVAGRMSPRPQPRLPGRGGPLAGASDTAAGEQQLPSGHPPLQIPDDVRDAIRGLSERAAAAPADVALWKQLGEVQYRAGLVDPTYLGAAETTYKHVLAHQPDDLDALRGLGNVAFDRQQPEAAIGYYERVLAARPDDRDVRTDLGTMYLTAGRTREAIDTYEAVLKAHPGFFQAQFNLALAYRAAGEPLRVVAALERAQAMAPDESTRQQVTEAIARLKAAPPTAAAAPAAPTAAGPLSFQADTERLFRENPVLGPKVQSIEWPDPLTVRVLVANFPMDRMGEAMHTTFVERMQGRLREKKAAHGVTASARIDFIDAPTGAVMATVTE